MQKRRIHYAIHTGSTRKYMAVVLGATGGGAEGYEWGGRGVSDAIVLPREQEKACCELKPLYL